MEENPGDDDVCDGLDKDKCRQDFRVQCKWNKNKGICKARSEEGQARIRAEQASDALLQTEMEENPDDDDDDDDVCDGLDKDK